MPLGTRTISSAFGASALPAAALLSSLQWAGARECSLEYVGAGHAAPFAGLKTGRFDVTGRFGSIGIRPIGWVES